MAEEAGHLSLFPRLLGLRRRPIEYYCWANPEDINSPWEPVMDSQILPSRPWDDAFASLYFPPITY